MQQKEWWAFMEAEMISHRSDSRLDKRERMSGDQTVKALGIGEILVL
jgi:hypothetical protein